MEGENLLEKGFPFPPPNHPPFPPKAFVMGEGSGRDLTEGLFFVFLNFFRAASPPVESLGKGGGAGEGEPLVPFMGVLQKGFPPRIIFFPTRIPNAKIS